MKDILFIKAASRNGGGIQGQVLRIARELAQRRLFQPILVTSSRDNSMAQSFDELGFAVYEASLLRKKDILKAACQIERILKRHDVALLESHMFRESLIARRVRMQHPHIPHIYRTHTDKNGLAMPTWRQAAHHYLEKLTTRYVDRYIANGNLVANEIIQRSGVSPDKVRVVINARDALGPPDLPVADPNRPLPPRIAMIANLTPRKGHDVLVEGLALLKHKGIRVTARLIGGELNRSAAESVSVTEQVQAAAARLGVLDQIEFYGYTHDVAAALEGIAVVALPSDSEGVPNCILEALSTRKLVVATAVGGVPEVVQDQVSGILHPPCDPQAFAQVLQQIFTQPARTWEPIRDRGYRVWQDRFQMDTMMDGFIAVYRELNLVN